MRRSLGNPITPSVRHYFGYHLQNGGVPSTPSDGANDASEAAAILSRLLAAVEAGEIEADTPQARRLLRRLEGAVGAWETPQRQ